MGLSQGHEGKNTTLHGVNCPQAVTLALMICAGLTQFAHADLVVHAEPELQALAAQSVRALARRGVVAEVGPPPPTIGEAVAHNHVALLQRVEALWVGVGGPHGQTHATTLVLDPEDAGAARAVAMAIESLVDEAAEAPAPTERPEGWVYLEYPEPERRPREGARPTIYLRLMAGYSPTRKRALVGPGAGLGLCVGAHCVTIEADLPLMPEEVRLEGGERLRYRAVSTSIRAQIRPIVIGDISLGVTLGILSRIGTASIVGGDYRRTITNFGFRGSLEFSWRIAGPVEWVVEAGTDVVLASSRARAFVHGQHVFLEDVWTPWVVASFRIRPEPDDS